MTGLSSLQTGFLLSSFIRLLLQAWQRLSENHPVILQINTSFNRDD